MLNLSVLQLNVDLWDLQFATLLLFTFHTPSQLFKCGIVDCVDKGNTQTQKKKAHLFLLHKNSLHKKNILFQRDPFFTLIFSASQEPGRAMTDVLVVQFN